MKAYLLKNAGDEVPVAFAEPVLSDVKVANGFFKRLTGLIFRKNILDSEGLLFENCCSIHTLWMRFALDVVFLDSNNRILRIISNLKPFRFTPVVKKSIKILELKAGISSELGIETGYYLKFIDQF